MSQESHDGFILSHFQAFNFSQPPLRDPYSRQPRHWSATGSTGRGRRTGDTAASWAGLWCARWMRSNREPERDSTCCGSQKDWFPVAAAWIVRKKKRTQWERGEPTKPGHLAEFTAALRLQENALFLLMSLGEQSACWEQVTRKEVFQRLAITKRGFVLSEWRWSVFVFLKDITYLFVSGGSGYFRGGRALCTALKCWGRKTLTVH